LYLPIGDEEEEEADVPFFYYYWKKTRRKKMKKKKNWRKLSECPLCCYTFAGSNQKYPFACC